jgi:hypothetical protein
VKRTIGERVLLGILALAMWALGLAALPLVYFLLFIMHRVNGGEYDDIVLKAHVSGVVLLLVSGGLLWGAAVLSGKALSS